MVSGFFPKSMNTVFILGDSTATVKEESARPETGWGEAFRKYLKPGWRLDNRAVNGRSTKDVIARGEFQAVRDSITSGDLVLIQYGHNDEKLDDAERGAPAWQEYIANLIYMAECVKEKGGRPVFITPIARRKFIDGRLSDTHGDWPAAMKYAAATAGIPCIDMTIPTMVDIAAMGDECSKKMFMNFGPGIYGNYPDGNQDDTHLSVEGAAWVARLISEHLSPIEDCCGHC